MSSYRLIYIFIHVYLFYYLSVLKNVDVDGAFPGEMPPIDDSPHGEMPTIFEGEMDKPVPFEGVHDFPMDVEHLDDPPLEAALEKQESSAEKKEKVKKIENFREGLDRLFKTLDRMVWLSRDSIFEMHATEAEAFVHCCDKQQPNDLEKLGEFVRVANSTEKKIKSIGQCITKSSKVSSACQRHFHAIQLIQNTIKHRFKLDLARNDTEVQEDLQNIDEHSQIDDAVYTKLVHYQLDTHPFNVCDHALILVWKPSRLALCAQSMMSLVEKGEMKIDQYEKFVKEVEYTFVNSLSNFIESIEKWQKQYLASVDKKKSKPPTDIKKETAEQIKYIRERFSPYAIVLHHPMIEYLNADAAAYRHCCHSVENYETMTMYLTYLSDDAASKGMEKLFDKCLHLAQGSLVVPSDDVKKQCNQALANRQMALDERDLFIQQHVADNPNLVKSFQEAISPDLAAARIYKKMEQKIEDVCAYTHLFELLFDSNRLIECEALILQSIEYDEVSRETFDKQVNQPFLSIILDHWTKLTKARNSILQPKHSSQKQKKPQSPAAQPAQQLGAPPGSGSISLISSQCFYLIIVFLAYLF